MGDNLFMSLNLNFTGVESSGGQVLPEGDYSFVIVDADVKEAKSGTSSNLVVKVEISEGEFAGKSFPQYINIQESTMWKAKQFLEAVLGTELDGEFDLDPSELVGQTVNGTLTNDGKYNSVGAWF
jgi:Protein of unknown function (DUF669)